MNHARRTNILALLLAVALLGCIVAAARLSRSRDRASAAAQDLSDARRQLADLAQLHGGAAPAGISPDSPDLNRRLRDAAAAAGIPDKLVNIDPGQPNRIENTDYNEMPVTLHLEPLTAGQLMTFLHRLAELDPASRAKTIELSTPQPPQAGEVWTADVALAYTTFAPREPQSQTQTQAKPPG